METSLNHVFKLSLAGMTPIVRDCASNSRQFCQWELDGNLSLRIIDVVDNPQLSGANRFIVAPTLQKDLEPILKRIIDDLSNIDRLMTGLGFQENN